MTHVLDGRAVGTGDHYELQRRIPTKNDAPLGSLGLFQTNSNSYRLVKKCFGA